MHSRASVLDLIPGAERILAQGALKLALPYEKVAISVFDRWLGPDLDQLDCRDAAEREERNARLLSLWARIHDETEVWGLGPDGRLARVVDREEFLQRCRYDPDRPGDQFTFVVLPELAALYKEDWDDTNVAWFKSESLIAPLLRWAEECDLHMLRYDA